MSSPFKLNLKNILILLGFIVLLAIIFLCGYKASNFIKFYSFSTKPISSSFAVSQLPTVPGQPIHWVKTVSLSKVTKTEHLLAIPKGAGQIKISTTSVKQLSLVPTKTLSKTELVKIALANRYSEASRVFAEKVKKDRDTGFWPSVSRIIFNLDPLLAAVGEVTMEEEAQTTEETALIDLAPVVEESIGEEIPAVEPELTQEQVMSEELTGEKMETVKETTEETVEEKIEEVATTTEEIIVEDIATTTKETEIPISGGGEGRRSDSEILITEQATSTTPSTDLVLVEYETPAPVIAEADTDTGKIVSVSSTSTEQDVITNVLAFTTIPEIFKVGQEDKIQIKWTNPSTGSGQATYMAFHAYDTNNNGKLDYVEWTVPHLSEQIFEIIFISKAFELDANKEIVNDVYEAVESQDDTWVTIPDTHYIRATFENILDARNDNTIYARPTSTEGSGATMPVIQVYPVYVDGLGNVTEGSLLTTFPAIDHEGQYKVLLTNLEIPTDTFDLKVVNGSVDFDYIVDPTCPGSMSGTGVEGDECLITNWTDLNNVRNGLGLWYKLTTDLSSTTSGYSGVGDNWTPIGWGNIYRGNNPGGAPSYHFTGVLKGDNHTIGDLVVNLPDQLYSGFLGSVNSGAVISNLGLVNVNIIGNSYTGGLVGGFYESTITNSYVMGTVSGVSVVGGLVGDMYSGAVIEYSHADVVVNASGDTIGGFVGLHNYASINDSYSLGNVIGRDGVGGFAGSDGNSGTVTNCFSIGNVIGRNTVGGFAGACSNSSITNSFATGEVTASSTPGGLCGGASGNSYTNNWWYNSLANGLGNSETNEIAGQYQKALSLTALKNVTHAVYTGTSPWSIGTSSVNLNNGYPYLSGATPTWYIWDPDIVPPIGTITLADGATYSTTTSPAITLTTDDADQYQLCLNSATSTNNCTSVARAWSSYTATPTAYDFGSDGAKTLYVQFKDTAGNISETYLDEITIDTTGPILSFTDNVEAGLVSSDTITPSWGDATVTKWDYDVDGTCSNTAGDYTKTEADSLNQSNRNNNGKYLCLYAEDALGNKTTLVSENDINISGGGGGVVTITPDCLYDDPAWSACVNNTQTRTLTATNQVCTGKDPKVEEQACVSPVATSTPFDQATSTATSTLPLATSTPAEATTTLIDNEEATTTVMAEEDSLIEETVTNLVTSDNTTPTNPTDQKNSHRSGGGEDKTITETLLTTLDVGTLIEDNIAVLGTTTEKIILGTKKALESPTGAVVTNTIITVGVVGGGVAASGVLAMSGTAVADILFLPFKLWGLLLSALGLKKRNRPWGTVYDSVTKQPLDPAYVTLKNLETGREVTSITDLDGRYGFLVAPGKYVITANKTNYTFPSEKLAGKTSDVLYNNLYFGGEIPTAVTGAVINKNIPLDPIKFDWNEFAKNKKQLMKFYSRREKIMRLITDWLFRVGCLISFVSLLLVSAPYNYIIFTLYLLLVLLRQFGLKQKTTGSLTDQAGNPLSYALIRVFDAELKVEITNKVADRIGHYYCLVNKGKYYVKIEKKNDDESYTEVFTSPVFEANKGIVKESFVV